MPKIKTHSGAKKRFQLTKSGKVKRAHSNTSKYAIKKSASRKRGLRQGTYTKDSHEATVKRLILYK